MKSAQGHMAKYVTMTAFYPF